MPVSAWVASLIRKFPIQLPLRLAKISRSGTGLISKPGVEIRLRNGFDNYGHKTMVFTAKFGALASIDARFVNLKPAFIDKPRYCVALNGKFRYPPGMQNII